MCMPHDQVCRHDRVRWEGDEIVFDPIICARRDLPGNRRESYEIDIRSFLEAGGNAVLSRAVAEVVESLPLAEQRLFRSRASGAFDFRADVIFDAMGRFRYKPQEDRFVTTDRDREPWLFPEETLALGEGDCEDLAFLLASLLATSGLSEHCWRVAFGQVVDHAARGGARGFDHAWVMYKNELGLWEVLEPLAGCRQAEHRARREVARPHRYPIRDVEYRPRFVLNQSHLWRIRSAGEEPGDPMASYFRDRSFWKGFSPAFALGVHRNILEEALRGKMPRRKISRIKRWGLWLDLNVLGYDPRDHFDFSYIEDGWRVVARRLATGRLKDFAYAAHGIADFYAHSVWADFAPRQNNALVIYDPTIDIGEPEYDFAPYAPLPNCDRSPEEAAAIWRGSLISGQWWRWYTSFPQELRDAPDFDRRFCLPDHDLIAVDKENPSDKHRRYPPAKYREQFRLRRDVAIRHIASAADSWQPA